MKRILIMISYLLLSLVGIGILASAVMLTANSAYAHSSATDQSINQTLAVKPDGSILVKNVAGTVKVRGWGKNQAQVTGTLTGGTTLDFHGVGDGAEIRVEYPQNERNNAQADLVIFIPASSRLSVNTVSADIEARDLTGSVQLESISGSIKLDSRSADISAKSVSGEVGVNGSAAGAHVAAHSVSGDVKVSHIYGDLQAESVSSTVKVYGQSRLSWAKISSTSGNVDFVAELTKGGSYTFNSISGNVALSFLEKPDARFDISSFSGDINNEFGPKAQRTSEYGPGEELHFVSGNGSAQVNARTLSGNITLKAP
jgi:DUF4097 and DUF4098 domain-containing protein YvlB